MKASFEIKDAIAFLIGFEIAADAIEIIIAISFLDGLLDHGPLQGIRSLIGLIDVIGATG